MISATRTFLSVTEIEPRIVPDATATLLPETFGATSTATTLQYVDDPSHPITATTLGFTDDPAHPITVTPANSSIPPTAPTPPTDTTPSADPYDWVDTLSDEQISYLLSLSDAELSAVLFGPIAPETPSMPVAGPSLPTDITPTLHGIEVGTSLLTPAAGPSLPEYITSAIQGINVGTNPSTLATGPSVVNTVYHFDPNAPPPTATTLEFTFGQQQGPMVTTLQYPAQAPPMTPAEALNRLQNQPQIVVVGSTPPVVQAAPVASGVPTTIRPGDEWLFSTTANGMYVPFMTKVAYAKMIADNIAANATKPSGWTFGATFGPTLSEMGNLISYAPTLYMSGDVPGTLPSHMREVNDMYNNYVTVRNNSDETQVGSAILAVLGYVGTPVNNGLVHVGNQVSTIYNQQRSSGEDIAGSVSTTFVYSLGSVMGLVDIHEAIEGREVRSGRELTSNERWSRGFLGVGSFLLSLAPLLPTGRAAAAGATADTAAGRALLEADVRASLQAAQAERRATAISRGERQAVVPERPAGPPGEGPVPRPEPVPPPAEALKSGQIAYGSTDLSQAAQAHRVAEGLTNSGKNIAIIEYRAADGSLKTVTKASEFTQGHAERLAAKELEALGIKPEQVTRVYSELQSCVIPTERAGCAAFLQKTFPQAEVSWSFEYGATKSSREAGVDALKKAASGLGK